MFVFRILNLFILYKTPAFYLIFLNGIDLQDRLDPPSRTLPYFQGWFSGRQVTYSFIPVTWQFHVEASLHCKATARFGSAVTQECHVMSWCHSVRMSFWLVGSDGISSPSFYHSPNDFSLFYGRSHLRLGMQTYGQSKPTIPLAFINWNAVHKELSMMNYLGFLTFGLHKKEEKIPFFQFIIFHSDNLMS